MKELKLSECKWPEVYISIPKEIAKESLQYQNKMTAVELRLGNYINYANSVKKLDAELFLQLLKYTTPFELIPLTEEWLLQFGFEKQHKELSHLSPLNLPETFNLPNSPFSYSQGKLILTTGTGDFCVYIEYVHQLQNLYFALTGEELTFKSE